jgi:hypothetical protein
LCWNSYRRDAGAKAVVVWWWKTVSGIVVGIRGHTVPATIAVYEQTLDAAETNAD